jgi:rhodanese-related sulfurtransferase
MVRDLLVIVVVGSLLGLGYNFLGIQTEDGWGLSWVAVDRVGELSEGPSVAAVEPAAAAPAPYMSDDPLAPAPTAQVALPEIPDVGRPVQIQIDALKQLFDAGAIFIVDAREDWEFAEGHIRGAVSVPFNTMGMDPAALEQLDAGGKPIVTYCGGGTCEVSLSLAWEMIGVGHAPIAVYMGGFPEWEAAGFAIETGAGATK